MKRALTGLEPEQLLQFGADEADAPVRRRQDRTGAAAAARVRVNALAWGKDHLVALHLCSDIGWVFDNEPTTPDHTLELIPWPDHGVRGVGQHIEHLSLNELARRGRRTDYLVIAAEGSLISTATSAPRRSEHDLKGPSGSAGSRSWMRPT
jgi:hypothetical protein